MVSEPGFKFETLREQLFKMESGMKMKVAVTFKGTNYLVWSRMVKTAVGSKSLRSEMDALIKMLKDNGNIHGYSFGASMIARTIEMTPNVAEIARID
ncbi:hypothetical protein IGI04_042541, partial [Brassica rapa subsp. trilocularis]